MAFNHTPVLSTKALDADQRNESNTKDILNSTLALTEPQTKHLSNKSGINGSGDKPGDFKGPAKKFNSLLHSSPDRGNVVSSPSSIPITNESPDRTDQDWSITRSSRADDGKLFDITQLPQKSLALNHPRNIHINDWSTQVQTELPRKPFTALILNAGWSPEYTAVVKRSVGKLGQTYGFNIGFKLNRWMISTGLQKSSKDYNAKKEDYEIESNSYYKNLTFINIQGNCNVLQWPVSVGYDLISSKFFTLQLNTSISSLRMNNEKYIYDYYHTNWKPGHDTHTYAFKNWHWLAAASTGLRIQKTIANHLAVSIHPYYQIPLKGIGEGKVHLKSFGSQNCA
jgi:hypothetical protein